MRSTSIGTAALLATLAVAVCVPPAAATGRIAGDTASVPAPDADHWCGDLLPGAEFINRTDWVDVRTLVLLDGVSLGRGQQIMSRAAHAYAPLRIGLTSEFQSVSFSGADAAGLIGQAKWRLGGQRPPGIDAVYVLTSKNISINGAQEHDGFADCIGGVRHRGDGFAVGEDWGGRENRPLGAGVVLYADASAKTAAHEIGHVLGSVHAYSSCAEGTRSFDDVVQASPCTVMINFADVRSLNFGLLDGGAVRYHALQYARP